MQTVSQFWTTVTTTMITAVVNGIFFTLAVRWITHTLDGKKEKKEVKPLK